MIPTARIPAGYREYLAASQPSNAYTRAISDRVGAAVAPALVAMRFGPNAITIVGGLLQVAPAAVLIAIGPPVSVATAVVIAAVWQVSYGLDCADGQVARVQRSASPRGAWLDQIVDVIGKIFVGAAIASAIATALGRDAATSALIAAALVGAPILLQIAVALRVALSRTSRPPGDRRPRWHAAIQLTDYGLYLLVTALLLPWPGIELGYQLVAAALFAAAALAVGFTIRAPIAT